MKNPTTNDNDLYQLGNDYPQGPVSSYFNEDSYADGIYTELSDTISGIQDPAGLNKRILNVLPQSGWADSTVPGFENEKIFSDEYATADVIENV